MVKKKNRCSFCGRTDEEVPVLLTGMDGYICSDCVRQAYKILDETMGLTSDDLAAKANNSVTDKPFEMKKVPKPLERSWIPVPSPGKSRSFWTSTS